MLSTASGYAAIIRSFKLDLEVSGLSKSTVSHYVRDVSRFLGWCESVSVSHSSIGSYREYLASISGLFSAKTIYEVQLALRKYIRFSYQEGMVSKDFSKTIKLMRYKVNPQPMYSIDEVKALLSACDVKTMLGTRDQAVIETLFETGIRVGELISMVVPDWDARLISVKGKKGVRLVPITSRVLLRIDRYVRKWRVTQGRLWRGKYGLLTESGVDKMIRRRCGQTGVYAKGVHAFRRASAANMKRMGMNDSDIMEIMGWEDVTMLRRYVSSVGLELAQTAYDRFDPGSVLRER